MWLIETTWVRRITAAGEGRRLAGVELCGRRWYLGIAGQPEGAPIVDTSARTETTHADGFVAQYWGALIKLRPTAGSGLVIASRWCTARDVHRFHLPSWLTRPRTRGELIPRRPLVDAAEMAWAPATWPTSVRNPMDPPPSRFDLMDSGPIDLGLSDVPDTIEWANREVPNVVHWVTFRGGSLHGHERPIRLPLEDGQTYNVCVPIDQTWKYSAERDVFELVEP